MTKYDAILKQYMTAIKRLDEVLKLEKNDIIRDSAIQRFEFTFDLAWKTLKAYLQEYQKVRCASPKKCFREAYKQDMIKYEDAWLTMADDRSNTAHLYKESMVNEVFSRLPQYLELFQELLRQLGREE